MKPKVLAITQARIGSSRLNSKVLLKLGTASVLDLHLKRLKKAKHLTNILVATTHEDGSDQILEIAKRQKCLSFQGDVNDVLDRFYQAAQAVKPDIVVRVTSDCPLIDPKYIDDLVQKFLATDVDYASNTLEPTLPDGCDAEIMWFDTLEEAWENAKLPSEREHVTPYIWKNSDAKGGELFSALMVKYAPDRSQYRLTLDEPQDYLVLTKLVDTLGEDASMEDYVRALDEHPEWRSLNSSIKANEGYARSLEKDAKNE